VEPAHPALVDRRKKGRLPVRGHLIWFNREKGYGFIRTEDGERLRVEESGFEPGNVISDRCGGTLLTFERDDSVPEEPRAVRASLVTSAPPRRARLRHR
jgi:'Cold-shock' DNA-binding domain